MFCSGIPKRRFGKLEEIWNEIIEVETVFPQMDRLNADTAEAFFGSQSYCGMAENRETGGIAGICILHPNNVGRCGHIANPVMPL